MIKTRLEPTFDHILIERIPEAEVTAGGIIIPQQSQAKPNQGYVRDVGPNVFRQVANPPIQDGFDTGFKVQTFQLGDKVMIGQFAGIDMTIDGANFTLIKQDEILCKIIEIDDGAPLEHA